MGNESVPIQLAQCWLWFEITKMLIAVQKIEFVASFIIIFGGTLSFPMGLLFLTQPAHTGGFTLDRRRAELK